MRVVFAILGAVLSLAFYSADRTWFSLLLGAVAGLGIAEALLLRQRLNQSEREISALAKLVERLRLQLEEPDRAQTLAQPTGPAAPTRPAPATDSRPAPAATPRPAQSSTPTHPAPAATPRPTQSSTPTHPAPAATPRPTQSSTPTHP